MYLQEYHSALDMKILIFSIDGVWWLTTTTLTEGKAVVEWWGKGERKDDSTEPACALDMCDVLWRLPYTSEWTSSAIQTFTGHDYLNLHFQHQSDKAEQLQLEADEFQKLNIALGKKIEELEQAKERAARDAPPINDKLKHGWANKMVALLGALQAGSTDQAEQLMKVCLGWSLAHVLAHVCNDVSLTTIKPHGYKQACWLM